MSSEEKSEMAGIERAETWWEKAKPIHDLYCQLFILVAAILIMAFLIWISKDTWDIQFIVLVIAWGIFTIYGVIKTLYLISKFYRAKGDFYSWSRVTNFGKTTTILKILSEKFEEDGVELSRNSLQDIETLTNAFETISPNQLFFIQGFLNSTRKYQNFMGNTIKITLALITSFIVFPAGSFNSLFKILLKQPEGSNSMHSISDMLGKIDGKSLFVAIVFTLVITIIVVNSIYENEKEKNTKEMLKVFVDSAIKNTEKANNKKVKSDRQNKNNKKSSSR